MPDLILMHGENGKTFFVDKEEYLAHWEWKKPTKYIDKYEKNGKTVYVYENDYKDTKGVNDTQHYVRAKTSPTYTKNMRGFTKAPDSKDKGYENVHSIDLRDNTRKVSKSNRSSVVDDFGTNRYLEYGYKTRIHDNNKDMYNDDVYVDARTGKEISALKVNAYATINQIKDSALQKIASTWLGKKYGIEGIKDYTKYDKYTYNGGMEKANAEEEHVDNYSKIIKEYNKKRDKAYELHDKRVESGKIKVDEYDPELEKDLNNAEATRSYRDTKEQKRYLEELENIKQHTNKRYTKKL